MLRNELQERIPLINSNIVYCKAIMSTELLAGSEDDYPGRTLSRFLRP